MPTLHWLSREEDLKAAAETEYRLLIEDEGLSYGDPDSGNVIVQGDNLSALKALLPSLWLSMMYPRLELLKQFLREDGVIFIQLDDNEQAYAKVICDEIFGRNNFTANIVWQKSFLLKMAQNDFQIIMTL